MDKLLIALPMPEVLSILIDQGSQVFQEYNIIEWTPPPGTTRTFDHEHTYRGAVISRHYQIMLPNGRQLTEVESIALKLSMLAVELTL